MVARKSEGGSLKWDHAKAKARLQPRSNSEHRGRSIWQLRRRWDGVWGVFVGDPRQQGPHTGLSKIVRNERDWTVAIATLRSPEAQNAEWNYSWHHLEATAEKRSRCYINTTSLFRRSQALCTLQEAWEDTNKRSGIKRPWCAAAKLWWLHQHNRSFERVFWWLQHISSRAAPPTSAWSAVLSHRSVGSLRATQSTLSILRLTFGLMQTLASSRNCSRR